ncbi:TPM domain-containing protein [Sinimarinibacterium sp. CAU 1509]|uniref:TPM domain-containing protein n=1 Tax=Sinimarinibacterium sp. CAU 1509 TaxID=2562283 RepID=UPI00200AC22A|nr:TPM domain-containing protein [Sinimarinibacterium sp. CAU 1509]
MRWCARLLTLCLVLLPVWAWAELAVPPVARVTDLTGTLSPEQQRSLSDRLAALEAAKGSQLAVLMVPTTQPETVEQYALRVAERWKLGRKGVDDGVLLLIAKNDRALRIEVGYGLEGVIPDAVANRVIDEIIVPRFKDGDFAGGVDAGVEQLTGLINGEALPAPRPRQGAEMSRRLEPLGFLVIVAVMIGQVLRAIFGRLLAGGLVGLGLGLIAWSISGVWVIGVLLAVLGFLFTVMGTVGGGWRSGGGGGFGSGSFGGGGFSGGGGSFGGGGASGRW